MFETAKPEKIQPERIPVKIRPVIKRNVLEKKPKFRKNRDIKSRVYNSCKSDLSSPGEFEASDSDKEPYSPFKKPDKVDFTTTNFLKPYNPHVRTELMDEDV